MARLAVCTVLVGSLVNVVVLPATARPRSWFLPPLNVSCRVGDSRPEVFTGAYDLNGAAALKGVLTVGGSVIGSCGTLGVDSLFRAPVRVEASCNEATLELADTRVGDATINFSEAPLVLTQEDVGKGALCSLAGAQKGSLKAQANALNKILALLS